MKSPICTLLGIEFPLLAFSHCRDVVAEVARAGGMGVFGAGQLTPARLEEDLAWIDAHVEGKPYGVDVLIPEKMADKHQDSAAAQSLPALPETHKTVADAVLARHGIDTLDLDEARARLLQLGRNLRVSGATQLLEVAFNHPIKLIANALGVPPAIMLELGKRHGVPVAALVGAREHAVKQVAAGVDIVEKCRPWCWYLKWSRRLAACARCRCSPPAASLPAARWRLAWPWGRLAPGQHRYG